MTTFKDSQGETWTMNITFADVQQVRENVIDTNGEPVDLLKIAEKGDFSSVSGSVQVVLNTVFWLVFPQLGRRGFSVEKFDADHAAEYEIFPDMKNRTPLQKAAVWFGERISGDGLLEIVRAWERALLNFIPNTKLRESVQNVMAKEEAYQNALLDAAEKKALEEIESRKLLLSAGQNGRSGALPENSVSTPAPTPTGPFT